METVYPMLSLFELRGFNNPGATLFQQYLKEENCPACGAKITVKSPKNAAIWVGATGSKWSDVLQCIDGLILHERVVNVIISEGLTGFIAHPLKIEKIGNKKLAEKGDPSYSIIEITGRVDIDVGQLDDVGGSVCPVCFTRNPAADNPYRWKEKRVFPLMETWDGSDFTRIRNLRWGIHYCSKRFIDLASRHKWRNFIFGQSLPGVGLWEKAPKEIDGLSYLDPLWFEKLSERVKIKHPDLFMRGFPP